MKRNDRHGLADALLLLSPLTPLSERRAWRGASCYFPSQPLHAGAQLPEDLRIWASAALAAVESTPVRKSLTRSGTRRVRASLRGHARAEEPYTNPNP